MLFPPSKFEDFLIKNDEKTILYYLMELNLIKRELICLKCCVATKLVKYTRNIDKFAWRCLNKDCGDYKKYFSVRYNSFFIKFKLSLENILRVVTKYACRQQLYSIKEALIFRGKLCRIY
ncbi:hypothetical protein H312_02445 [Anncaliia algerae PRA339]|uniref:Uncharacterized protein n=1 Tax=Anncaliia algerae PRA339 TaxID=1288291 RepID=A0A059EYN8_9MICR|nr:hypothetical protein H312_02445 [Anncaliia algerae PRA339]